MQIHSFSVGGGVIHKIPFRGNFLSAWFSPTGALVGIEGHSPSFRPVRTGKEAEARAQSVGNAYRDKFIPASLS